MLNRNIRNRDLLTREVLFVGGRGHLLNRHAHFLPYSPANATHEEDYCELEIALPGFGKDEVRIDISDKILTIRASHNNNIHHHENLFILQEYEYNTFEKHFQLTHQTDTNKIEAQFENGVLKLRLHRAQQEA